MNTKSKAILFGVLVAAVVAVGAYFIFRGPSTAYLKALPKNVIALARLDVRELLDDANFSQEEMQQLSQRIALSDDERATIGIDFTLPVYGFASRDGYFGVLAAVAHAGDVTSWCERLRAEGYASEVSEQRGYSWVVLEQQWLMAFDGEKALAMGPAVGAAQDQLRSVMARLLEQDRDDSGLETELYDTMDKKDDPLVAVASPELLPEDALQPLHALGLASAAQGFYLLSAFTDNNELALDAEIIPRNEDGEEELDYYNDLLRPIRASLMDHAHADNVLWMALNIEGKDLLELLRSNPTVRTALVAINLVMDVDRILEAIDGDVAVEITNDGGIHPNFGGSLTAQVEHTDFLSGASSWGNKYLRVQALSDTEYALDIPDMPQVFFGVKDKVIHVGSERALPSEGNPYLREERSDIKGARFYATVNLQAIPYGPVPVGAQFLKHFERLNIQMKRVGEFTFTLKASEDTNILKEALKIED